MRLLPAKVSKMPNTTAVKLQIKSPNRLLTVGQTKIFFSLFFISMWLRFYWLYSSSMAAMTLSIAFNDLVNISTLYLGDLLYESDSFWIFEVEIPINIVGGIHSFFDIGDFHQLFQATLFYVAVWIESALAVPDYSVGGQICTVMFLVFDLGMRPEALSISNASYIALKEMLWKGNLSYFCKESGSASCILPLYSNRYKAPFCSSSTNSFIYAISSRFVCNSLFTNSMDSFTSFWALCSVIQSLPAKVMIIPNMTARKLRKKSPNLYSVLICFAFSISCFHVFWTYVYQR